jgi:hypothetical protein
LINNIDDLELVDDSEEENDNKEKKKIKKTKIFGI